MIKKFSQYLRSLGVNETKEIGESAIAFEYNELSFIFSSDKSDPYYMRLILPNIATSSDYLKNKNEIDIYKEINEYNSKYKAAKMIFFEKSIWLSVEQFAYSQEKVTDLFSRMIRVLESVITDFRKKQEKIQ